MSDGGLWGPFGRPSYSAQTYMRLPLFAPRIEVEREETRITHPVSINVERIKVPARIWDKIEADIQIHPRSAIRTMCEILKIKTPRAFRFSPGRCYAKAVHPNISIVDLKDGISEPGKYILETVAMTDNCTKTGNGIRIALQEYAQQLLHPNPVAAQQNPDKPHDIYLALHRSYHTVKYARLERAEA